MKILKLQALYILMIILLMASALGILFNAGSTPARAEIGQITVYPDITENATGVLDYQDINGEHWGDIKSEQYATSVSTTWVKSEIYCAEEPTEYMSIERSVICWDLGSANITSLDDISSVTVRLRYFSRQNTFGGISPSVSLYRVTKPLHNGYGGNLSIYDYNNLVTNDRVSSQVFGYNEQATVTWVEFPIYQENIGDVLWVDNGYAYVALADVNYDENGNQPNWGSHHIVNMVFDGTGASHPILEIVKLGELPEIEIKTHDNDPIDITITGAEVADNITWSSPRAAYANEGMEFIVAGDSGAPVHLQLKDKNNSVLAEHTDSIRTNGFYYYQLDIPDATEGFVFMIETNFNIRSEWGYVSPAYDSSMASPYTYAGTTEYPQYDNAFSEYVVRAGDYLVYHWKTPLSVAELDDASFRIWYLNDSANELFNYTLADLNDIYFKCWSENDFLACLRFVVIALDTGGTGWSNYDGMAILLGLHYDWSTEGYYTVSIYEDGVGEYAVPHSAFWYLNDVNQDGVFTSLDNSQYNAGQDITATLSAGDASKVRTELNLLTVQIFDAEENIVLSGDKPVVSRDTEVSLSAPMLNGDYTARFTLHKAGKSYEYVHDVGFTVKGGEGGGGGGGGTDGIIGSIGSWLERYGLDNAGGHWLALIIGMLALFALCYKSELMRVIFPLCLFATAIIFGWIDMWFVILLAFGAGIFIWSALRKKLAGGSSD